MHQMCFIPSDYVVPYCLVKGILFSNLNSNLDIPLKVYPQILILSHLFLDFVSNHSMIAFMIEDQKSNFAHI